MYSASLGDEIETELCADRIFETGLSIQTPSSSDRLSDRHCDKYAFSAEDVHVMDILRNRLSPRGPF